MANTYVITKVINGKEYKAQFNGLSAALKAVDNSYIDGTNNVSVEKLSTYLFENVIVEPKGLTADDFDSMNEFNDVINFAREVMQGDFREKKNESGAKRASKE